MDSLIVNSKLNLKNQEFNQDTVRSLWLKGIDSLRGCSISDSELESELLLRAALGFSKSDFFSSLRNIVPENERLLVEQLIQRRMAGEPTSYILGCKEFYGIEFCVSKEVLIPRPETELIVDLSLNKIKDNFLIADIGTGSGCIAVSIAAHSRDIKIIAVDKSIDALRVARKNLIRHGMIETIDLVNADLLTSFRPGLKFDLIVSNPPYIPLNIYRRLPQEIKYEPDIALNGGLDGLEIIRCLVWQANELLSDGGSLLFEVFSECSREAVNLTSELMPGTKITVHNDLLGLPRVIEAAKL
jgi:release factor glutamine methyltransferase